MACKKTNNFISYIVLFLICALVYLIYFSPYFERTKPSIDVPDISYWNLKWKVPINISDVSGIKSYKITLQIDNEKEEIIINQKDINEKSISISLPPPKSNVQSGSILKYTIQAIDNSKYNFLLGNKSQANLEIIVDKKLPDVRIIAMSNKIMKGGSAVVVFYANDDAMGNISLTNGKDSLIAFPYIKDNYYVSIIPWPIRNESFNGSIIVQDKAGNTKKAKIGFTKYSKNYRTSNIALKDSFIDNKITELIENANEYQIEDFNGKLAMFRYVNEVLREKDSQAMSAKILNLQESNSFIPKVFIPLKSPLIVGLYGDYRKYIINKNYAGTSYHLGIDLANAKNAPITASNPGLVVLSDSLGVHGNTMVIDHGLGISSLYAHMSAMYKKEGDTINEGDIIGRTGDSGLALGDHLHFGIFIQGIPVIPNEWMDNKWLKVNIINILEDAKTIIENDNDIESKK